MASKPAPKKSAQSSPTATRSAKTPATATKKAAAKRPAKGQALLDGMREFVRARASQYLTDPNITSIGIGYRRVDGKPTAELSVQFTVAEKAVPESLGALNTTPIPASIEINGVLVPTDVIQRSYKPSYREIKLEAKDPRKERADMMVPGMSIGNVLTTAGTIGAFVRDRATKQVLLLSNWHVLHGPGGFVGVDVVQPGKHDDNRVDLNKIGKLVRSHLGPAGDCAVASISGRSVSNQVFELDRAITAIGAPELGDAVIKSGRTTGVTRGKVVRIEVNTKLVYGGGVEATIGGFEIGVDEANAPSDGEISRGGDSGSAWLAIDGQGRVTGIMLGLHFAGEADSSADEYALACYAKSVMTALDIEPLGTLAEAEAEALTLADGLVPRDGFDQNFLPFAVQPPKFSKTLRADLAELEDEPELKYCHFSVWLSKKRLYPACVCWNIDGSQFKRIARTNFRADRRGTLAQYQLTDDIYKFNPFDKGHIARRADLCWGTPDEARQGNYDSFYYTNIAPQHEAFNQSDNVNDDPEGGVWGRLENTVLDSEKPHKLKVSLMGGPVFGPNDRRFEQNGVNCLIPDEFWKVVLFHDTDDNKDKAFAFLLTQAHLVEALATPEGINFEPWLWARIGFRDLEARTGLKFPAGVVKIESPFATPETLLDGPALKLLKSPSDYFK
jgi:endonuclease G, mitochondrial